MSGEKITARLRTERDLSNGKERIQVYEVGRYLVIIRGDRKSTGQRLHVEIHYGDNHDERVEKEGSYPPIYIPMDASMMMGSLLCRHQSKHYILRHPFPR